jgi:sugar lactone lactonase YvrE
VDPADGTLWAVADPLNVGHVYHLERDGTLISTFPTASFDPASISPQDVAVDPFDGTLWITDNESRKVYNVTKTGSLVSSFSALLYTSVLDPGIPNPNPQGISVDGANGSLWVTDRNTNRIYNVDSGRGGTTPGNLRSSFASTTYDGDSHNPTGVAYEAPVVVPALPAWGGPVLSLGLLAAGRRASGRRRAGSQRGTRAQYSA